MKVLFADDKETWHRLFEIVLSLRGIDVFHAYTPKETINKAVSEKPDVVIADVTLSSGSAYDVIKDITDLGIPVIVIGHRAEGFDPEKAKSLGAYAVLEKPFTVEDLVSLLRELKREKPFLEVEKEEALLIPAGGEVQELVPEEEGVIDLEESPVETIELEEVEPQETIELKEPEITLEHQSPVEEVVKSTSEEISKLPEVNLPAEKVEEIIREVAWEVIPEIAEKVIREEVEKLIKSRLA